MQSPRTAIILGLAAIAMILGSGVLMSIFLIKEQEAQVSQADWEALNRDIDALFGALASEETSAVEVAAETAHEPDTSPVDLALVPINSASQPTLETLPGIGPARAAAIIEARVSGGPFRDLADLDRRVSKIPNSVIEDISDKISFE